ncbi:MAG: hypothetical protein Kow00114_20430 [Kiloniellaceae bacterium]
MRATEFPVVAGIENLPGPSAAVIDLLNAWKAARRGRLVPLKRDFDPLAVFPLLPDLWIYHYERKENVFRCRLAGERINAAWGRSIAGKTSREIFGAPDDGIIVTIWKKILETPLVHYGRLERLSGTRLYTAERIVVPLAEASGSPDYVLGLSLYSLGGSGDVKPPTIPENAVHIHCRDL